MFSISCPNCNNKTSEGNYTVMNHVDMVLQVPSFLRRIGEKNNGHIMECPNCHSYFDVDSNQPLTAKEKKEVNKMWDELPKEKKY